MYIYICLILTATLSTYIYDFKLYFSKNKLIGGLLLPIDDILCASGHTFLEIF